MAAIEGKQSVKVGGGNYLPIVVKAEHPTCSTLTSSCVAALLVQDGEQCHTVS